MQYSYRHEKVFADGSKVLANIIWDSEGNWPMENGKFPLAHPSYRYAKEFEVFRGRGFEVTFLAQDGDRCSLDLLRSQSEPQVIADINEFLGWEQATHR